MLPGLRILFATTILAISILVFGLGAAALLRAAHEEFASLTLWRPAQQPVVGQVHLAHGAAAQRAQQPVLLKISGRGPHAGIIVTPFQRIAPFQRACAAQLRAAASRSMVRTVSASVSPHVPASSRVSSPSTSNRLNSRSRTLLL